MKDDREVTSSDLEKSSNPEKLPEECFEDMTLEGEVLVTDGATRSLTPRHPS